MENKRVYSRNEYMERLENKPIDIVDLIGYVMLRWRVVLIIAIPLFLLCVFGLVLKSRNSVSEPVQITADTLQPIARRRVNSTLQLYNELANMEAYKDKSAYMSLNPYDCNVHTLKYLIRDIDIPSGEGYEIYKEFVEEGELKQIIEKEFGKELVQPSELVNISNNTILEIGNKTKIDFNNHVLSVKIVTGDTEINREITACVKKAFSDYHKRMLAAIGRHDVELLSEGDYVGSDLDVEDTQTKFKSDMSQLRAQISNVETQMSDEEKSVLESLKTLESEENKTNGEIEEDISSADRVSKKLLFAALILCFGFSCCVIAGYYIFCGKLKKGEELISLFNLPYIGRLSKKIFDSEKVMVEDELWMICSETGQKEINLFPLERYPDAENYLQQLKNDLKERGILLNVIQSLTFDFNMAQSEKGCKNIVLLVKRYRTMYSSIDKILQKCERWNINIVGVMNIEN